MSEKRLENERVFLLMATATTREQPAYCPDETASSFEEAYAPFIFVSEDAALADVRDSISMNRDGSDPADIDDDYSEEDELADSDEYTRRGIIRDDGSIQFTDNHGVEDDILDVAVIYNAFGLDPPSFNRSITL